MLETGKKLYVFSIRQGRDGERSERKDGKNEFWNKAGVAFVNRDGSMNLYLDVLPLDGKLHVREANEKRDAANGSLDATHRTSMEAH